MQKFQPNPSDLRSTMPSTFGQKFRRVQTDGDQSIQKLANVSTSEPLSQEINSKIFFVRVSPANLEEQKENYEWRTKCSENVIGVKAYKIQSEGNCFNSNHLFKIQLEISKSNFAFIKNINLTKCITIMKTGLKGLKNLFVKFQPFFINEQMIYVSQEGWAKVWMDERFYINPNNMLYPKKQINNVSDIKTFRNFIALLEPKCLKTKLSQKFFSILLQKKTIDDSLQAIEAFEAEENLFLKNSARFSISTSPGLTLSRSSSSIEFSQAGLSKKKKQRSEKNLKTNMVSEKKFLQVKSLQFKNVQGTLLKKKKGKIVSKSQSQQAIHESEGNPQSMTQHSQSVVTSEIFKYISSNPIPKILQASREINANAKISLGLGQSIRQYNFNQKFQQILLEHSQQSPPATLVGKILTENNWAKSIDFLYDKMHNFQVKSVNKSIIIGKQQDIQLKDLRLTKLHTIGKEIFQSSISIHQQSFEDY